LLGLGSLVLVVGSFYLIEVLLEALLEISCLLYGLLRRCRVSKYSFYSFVSIDKLFMSQFYVTMQVLIVSQRQHLKAVNQIRQVWVLVLLDFKGRRNCNDSLFAGLFTLIRLLEDLKS